MTPEQRANESVASTIHGQVNAQFGAAAAAYSHSPAHSNPDALRKVVELASPQADDVALDIATGAGHTALALAAHVAKVIAYDMTGEMLLETRRNAAARGLTNVVTEKGIAEQLPFPGSAFDIITVRQAPHHFANVQAALSEMARVAKPDARLVIVDTTTMEEAALDAQWNHIEKLRDPSHVRNYRPSEWRVMLTQAGLRILSEEMDFCTENGHGLSFAAWTRRMNTPAHAVQELEAIFHHASAALREALRIEIVNGAISFHVPQISILAARQ